MSKLSHKQKVKLATRMRTHDELVRRVPIFLCKGWSDRRDKIRHETLSKQRV